MLHYYISTEINDSFFQKFFKFHFGKKLVTNFQAFVNTYINCADIPHLWCFLYAEQRKIHRVKSGSEIKYP